MLVFGVYVRGWWRESFFGSAEKATSRPAWRSDYGGSEQCSAKPRLRPASVPEGDSISPEFKRQRETPPDKAGWRFSLMVEPAGIEPASASPLQAALHT